MKRKFGWRFRDRTVTQGNKCVTITLPVDWVRANDIVPGTKLQCYLDSDMRSLVLTTSFRR